MTVYFNVNLLENHCLSKVPIPILFLYPADGRGLLARRGEYKVLENDAQLNKWVSQLCQNEENLPAEMDKENRKFIPVKKIGLQEEYTFKFAKAESLSRIKKIVVFADIYPEDAKVRIKRALKSEHVLIYHKALLGAYVQNQNNRI